MGKQRSSIIITIFFLMYIVLPNYFALEISESLPLLTGSRLLLLLMIFYYLCRNSWKIQFKLSDSKTLGLGITIYFILLFITNLFYVTVTSEAIKAILTIILEELILVWVITKLITTKIILQKCLQLLVFSSGVLGLLSIIESIIGVNIFYYINTVSREMLMASFSRMGYYRAEAGFGHAVYYGAYCVVMIPICMYFIENTRKNYIYIVCFCLNIVGLVFSNSRGSLLAFIFIMLIMLITKKQKDLLKYRWLIFLIIFISIITYIFVPTVTTFISDIVLSIFNIFSENSTEILNYGINKGGLDSRLLQITGIIWAFSKNPLFGLGAGAHTRGLMYYNANGHWLKTNTFDVGYIGIFCQYGIIGTIGYLVLFAFLFRLSVLSRFRDQGGLQKMFKYCFIAYFLCLLSISGIQKLLWTIIALFAAYINIFQNDKSI